MELDSKVVREMIDDLPKKILCVIPRVIVENLSNSSDQVKL